MPKLSAVNISPELELDESINPYLEDDLYTALDTAAMSSGRVYDLCGVLRAVIRTMPPNSSTTKQLIFLVDEIISINTRTYDRVNEAINISGEMSDER